MAQLLVVGHGRVADPLGIYLREALPNDYLVVANPVVCRQEIAAVVVGPAGVTVIDVEEAPPADTDAPVAEAHSLQAVRRFLAEEFGALRLPVFHFRAAAPPVRVTNWAVKELATWRVIEPADAAGQELAQAIAALPVNAECALADPVLREQIAIAFRDRQISPWQRTSR
ncbi:MAG: hypothetical protein WHX53_14695, partial [Anaerolineae bacterium]